MRELCAFADAPNLETALQKLDNWGVGAVVVHQGAQGAGYFAAGELVNRPPTPVTKRLIATGTGDVAMPEASVTAVTVVLPPKVADAPLVGAENETTAFATGRDAPSITFACNALPKAVPTTALCGEPETTVSD